MKNNKHIIQTKYKNYLFRSRLEARWAYFFDQIGVEYLYEAEGYEFFGKRYLPDFRLNIHACNLNYDIFIEVKPEMPNREEVYKAKWLAECTQNCVYIFFGDIWPPDKGGAKAILFEPSKFNLKCYGNKTPEVEKIEDMPLFLPQNIHAILFRLETIGCLLTVRTNVKQIFEIRCSWQPLDHQYDSSHSYPSPNEVISAMQDYNEIEDIFKNIINDHITRALEHVESLKNHKIIFSFTIQSTKKREEYTKHHWVSCKSCKHVGIYPESFSHDVDCMICYGVDGHELELTDEEYNKRDLLFVKESKKIMAAYAAARAARFEYGESPDV